MIWLVVAMGVVVLLAGILAVPLHVRFSAALNGPGERLHKSGRVRWAFGLVDFSLRGRQEAKRSKKNIQRESLPKPRSRIRPVRFLLDPTIRQKVWVLLRRLLGAAQWRAFQLDALIGLDDPAETGMLWGLIGPAVYSIFPFGQAVAIRPVFDGAALAFHSEGEVRIIPLSVVWVMLSFAASPALWRAVRPIIRAR